MRRLTLGDIKSSNIPEDALNIGPTDPRLVQYVNEASERLLHKGLYWSTYAVYRTNLTSQIFTLPPQLDTIERVNIGTVPLPLRGEFYIFLQSGWGSRDATLPNGSGVPEVLNLGLFPTQADIPSPGGTLTVKCDRITDVGKTVLILGYDTATPPNWIRTSQAGVIADGEVVALAQGAGTNTVNSFSKITDIQNPPNLDGQIWVFQGGITGTLLSRYEWFEVHPMYQRYLVPFINTTVSTIDLVGKKAFYPVANDNDYLVISNLAAIKLGVMACKAEAEHDLGAASILWNGGETKSGQKIIGAIGELQSELEHMTGSGREIGIDIKGSDIGYLCPVEPIV